MKNWIKKVVAGAVVLSSSIGLAGCSIFKDAPSQEGYVFKGYEDTYYVNDEFSIVGTKLCITDKKGKTEEISVTHDMIKHMPDMTSAGEKTVVIEYNGVEYSFTITIENRTNEQLLAKLKSFLRRYESNKDSLIDAGVVTNLQAKYLDEMVNINEQEAVTILSQMFDNDKLMDTTYNALFDAIVQGSFELDENYIINSNEFKAKLDTLKVIEKVKQDMSKFDLRTYLIDLALPRTDAYYIGVVADYICTICEIESISGNREINRLVSTYYYKLKNFESFDVSDAYTELLNKINIHSINPVVKEATADLNTKDPEVILHIFSSMVEKQWLNYGNVMTTDNYAKHKHADADAKFENTEFAKNLIKQKASAEKIIAYRFETAIKDLVNCSSVEELEQVVLSYLSANSMYAQKMINVIEAQKANNLIIVMKYEDYCDTTIEGPMQSYNGIYSFKPYYDDEIEYYTSVRDNAQKYYDDINEQGFVGAVERNALVEELFEHFEYPEENKQEAIDNIYSILNSELEGEDLYWAIADVLFPNGANEHIEEVKNIVKSYLNNGLVSAIEENELVEKLIDFIGNYPEEYKQQAIDTIYSILKGEKSGKDLYLDIVKILTPNANDYYIDYACEFINEYLSIESVTGQDEIRAIITKYFENLKTATEFNVRDAYTEILTAINIHSTNEMVKVATKDLKSLEIKQMIHLISDIVYTQNLESTQIATIVGDGHYHSNYQITQSSEAQDVVDRYATNIRNEIRAYEDAVWNLLSATSVEDLFNIVLNWVSAEENYYAEEIAIVETLEEHKWLLGEEYEYTYFNGREYVTNKGFATYYYAQQDYMWDSITHQSKYVWVGYNQELIWLNETKHDVAGVYNYIDLTKSLVFEPREAIDTLLEKYKQEVVEYALEICHNYLGVGRDSYMASDLKDIFTDAINDYLVGELDKEKLLADIEEIINVYATDDTKTILNVGYMLYNSLNYDESIDYNEVFKDITLPNQVESIDYNKLMSQVMDKETYDIFKFSDIEVEYIQDESGKIVAEKLTLKVDVDFDVLISSLKGDMVFTLTLDFEPEDRSGDNA